MTQHPFHQGFAQNKGTLVPGQSIAINQHTVQVERYLSQGGFAHVYLVTTATPVFNTNRHVLKRIAVPSESMLAEVKKEVDIMRIFKGHPNIVQLIDAAWHRMSTGMYEVFILMEFCTGGGIIDMMNRRLRERLTEAEILTIFVDVCEGVAAMHNLRPPLLHRDLKVENILQSSETSYKLCDFGSATPVAPRPPSSTNEIRALEADLNRHTTLQYRAPEMVDPYMRRPIDEKSDVWALGVLLYKLCYYTTPFEEHGPLAILNAQYRTPSYPHYSGQMNAIIASMLQEHGARRPHVFEILATVHRIRGSKSRFNYVVPTPPPLSPRSLQFPQSVSTTDSLHKLMANRSATNTNTSPGRNTGVQAREKFLEAIAPMRRGRVTDTMSAPLREVQGTDWLGGSRFKEEEDRAWKSVNSREDLGGKSPQSIDTDAWKVKSSSPDDLDSGAWTARGEQDKYKDAASNDHAPPSPLRGFGDDFSSQKIWDPVTLSPALRASSSGKPLPGLLEPPNSRAIDSHRGANSTPSSVKARDAFEGLGLSVPNKLPAPTLGEARKLRTGLAIMHGSSKVSQPILNDVTSQSSSIPSVARLTPPSICQSPAVHPSTSPSSRPASKQPSALPPEARFPSLEELDASFDPPGVTRHTGLPVPSLDKISHSPSLSLRSGHSTGGLRPLPQVGISHEGVRSEQVTGIAMRIAGKSISGKRPEDNAAGASSSTSKSDMPTASNAALARNRRSSTSAKRKESSINLLGGPKSQSSSTGKGMDRRATSHTTQESEDQNHGLDDERKPRDNTTLVAGSSHRAVLRDSPGKRAIYEQARTLAQSPQEATTQQTTSSRSRRPSSPTPAKTKASATGLTRASRPADLITVFKNTDNAGGASKSTWNSVLLQETLDSKDSSSSADEGPEDASGYVPPTRSGKGTTRHKGKAGQGSVHELVDLWSAGANDGEKETGRSPAATTPKDFNAQPKAFKGEADLPVIPRAGSPQKPPSAGLLAGGSPKPPHTRRSSKAGIATPSPTPLRASRPQSMFLFPASNSRGGDDPSTPKTSLPVPSQVQTKSGVSRRTSISDMVHRYEAMDEKAKGHMPLTSAPLSTGSKLDSPVAHGNGRYPRTLDAAPAMSPKVNARSDFTSFPQEEPSTGFDKVRISAAASRRKESKGVGQVAAKIPVSEPSLASNTSAEERPASPDKPYQGVSKLIDQWQRKTAEADPSNVPPPRRSRFVGK